MIKLTHFLFFFLRIAYTKTYSINSKLNDKVQVVFYKTEQRHHDEGDSLTRYSRNLKCQTFASTGRYKSNDVFTRLSGVDDLSLVFSKISIAKDLLIGKIYFFVPGKLLLPFSPIVSLK